MVELFTRNALKALRNNRPAIGLQETDELSVSYVSGGIVVNDSLIGHVTVGKVRADTGHFLISFVPSENDWTKGFPHRFLWTDS